MPFSSDPKEGHAGSILHFPDISPTASVVSQRGPLHLHHARDCQCRGRGRETKKAKHAATCSRAASRVHTLVQRPGCIGGWGAQGFFCLPRYPFTGLLHASPTVPPRGSPAVQAIAGFANPRMRSWEEAGKQRSWDGGLEVAQPGWVIRRDVGDNFYSWQVNGPLFLCSWK